MIELNRKLQSKVTDKEEEHLTAYESVSSAHELWTFMFCICSALRSGEIPLDVLNKPVTIITGGRKSAHIRPKWELSRLDNLQYHLFICVTGSYLVTLDDALNKLLGGKQKQYLDSDIDALRAIIYMIRCAFAHSPTSPVWLIKEKYRRKFQIESIGFEVDFSDLNGKGVNPTHFKGWKSIFTLTEHCVGVIKELSKK